VIRAKTESFQGFFETGEYVALKNSLFNYQLRRSAVRRAVQKQDGGLTLEMGSGISPMSEDLDRTVFLDYSWTALRILRRGQGRGMYVAADCMNLPFRPHVFSQALCSEVLEHLEDDQAALKEAAGALKPGGRLVLTFPHRKAYFSIDDRLVGHRRRYELAEMKNRLTAAGFRPVRIGKVLGPLEKATTILLASAFIFYGKAKKGGPYSSSRPGPFLAFTFKWINNILTPLFRLEAWVTPRRSATVLLMDCVLKPSPGGGELGV